MVSDNSMQVNHSNALDITADQLEFTGNVVEWVEPGRVSLTARRALALAGNTVRRAGSRETDLKLLQINLGSEILQSISVRNSTITSVRPYKALRFTFGHFLGSVTRPDVS